MAARADIWLRKKNGKPDSWYFQKVRLRTKDAIEGRQRARLAKIGKWPPAEEAAAKASVESFSLPGGIESVSQAPVAPLVSSSPPSAAPDQTPPPADGDWTNVAAAAAADASEPIKPDVVNHAAEQEARDASNAEVAKVILGMQLWATEQLIKSKVWKGFVAPSMPEDARAAMAQPYKTMLDYGGAAIKLPPWVQGLVIPAATALFTAAAVSRMWADMAREQKAHAEATAPQTPAAAAA